MNYHALRFKPYIMKISSEIVNRLRSQGHFMSIHLRFEMDMLAFAGYKRLCFYLCPCLGRFCILFTKFYALCSIGLVYRYMLSCVVYHCKIRNIAYSYTINQEYGL